MISPSDWAPVDGIVLEPNAMKAVKLSHSNVGVLAGPGAGKTEMLAQKADFLFNTGICPYPQRILAISFKVDAASNLRERVRRRCGNRITARFDSQTFHAFANRIIRRFGSVLTGPDQISRHYTVGSNRTSASNISYDDLVPTALKVVKASSAARHAVRQTYSHVFLDEFQDCTKQQYALVQELFATSGAHITAVGDSKQMIMLWAGAQVGNFALLRRDFATVPLSLYQNFRSKPRLRRMQNAMVSIMDPSAALPMSKIPGDEGLVKVLGFGDDSEEAHHVARLIQDLIDSGTEASEIAVLVPQVPHQFAGPLMNELTSGNIAYRNEQQVQDLGAEPVAGIIFDFLRVAGGVQEAQAYERLMQISKWRMAGEGDELARRRVIERQVKATRPRLLGSAPISDHELRGIIAGFIDSLDRESIAEMSHEHLGMQGLDDLIDKVIVELNDQRSSGKDLQAALRSLASPDAVRILTTHKSKGLEFDAVIMLGVEQESYFSRSVEQDRNAFFVGISRARTSLVLTTASRRPLTQSKMSWWKERRHPHQEFLSYSSNSV